MSREGMSPEAAERRREYEREYYHTHKQEHKQRQKRYMERKIAKAAMEKTQQDAAKELLPTPFGEAAKAAGITEAQLLAALKNLVR